MEPVTNISNALAAAGAVAAEGTIPEPARELHVRLKNLISSRFDGRSDTKGSWVLAEHETDPETWVRPLEKSLTEAEADKDQKIMETVNALITALENSPSGNRILGKYNPALPEGQPHDAPGIRAKDCQIGVVGDGTSVDKVYFGNTVRGEKIQGVTQAERINNLHLYFQADENKGDPQKMRMAYLYRLLCDANILSLEGIDPKAASCDTERLNLGAVYTALLTKSADHQELGMMRSSEARQFSALEIVNGHPHTVLLGDPGSGKTTFVNFLTLCLAGEGLGHPQANLDLLTRPLPPDDEDDDKKGNEDGEKHENQERQPWKHGAPLPVRIILRDFAAGNLSDSGASAAGLWQFIRDELRKAELSEFAPHLKRELQEKGGLLMLDGLDEIPEADKQRVRIRAVVEDFMKTFRMCRVLVTSRTYAYQRQEWRIPGLYESELAPFSKRQIRCFTDRWYAHFAELKGSSNEDAQGRAAETGHFLQQPPERACGASPAADPHGKPALMAGRKSAGKTGRTVCRHCRPAPGLVGKPQDCPG